MTNLSDRATGLTNVNQINLNELSSSPSNPGAGQKKFYAKDDGKVYTLDSTGKEREVGSGSGASREIEQTGHGFAVGDVLYFDGTDYVKAQADDEATAEVVGVVSSIVDVNKFVVTSSGYIEEGLSGLTAGSVYYLSASTAGSLTLTEPGVIGHVSKPMLLADSATSGYVLQYRGVLVGAVFNEDTPLNADNLTEGTVSSARLPEATSSQLGAVTKPLFYHARLATDRTLTNNTLTVMSNLTAYNNPGGAWNLTTGGFTVPSDGVYFFAAQVFVAPFAAGTAQIRVTKNGSTASLPGLFSNIRSPDVDGTTTHVTGLAILTAGDIVYFYAYVYGGAGQIRTASGATDYSNFQIVKVNAAVS